MNTTYEVTIPPLHKKTGEDVASYIDTLTKPLNSLGRLESIAIELAEMTGERFPKVSPPAAIVFAADHGITNEGVSAFPKEVTAQMVENFLQGGAAMNVFCEQIDALFTIVDVGVGVDIADDHLTVEKIRYGTRNFLQESAMTAEETMHSLEIGKKEVQKMLSKGARCIIVGEMGIGNTTVASAIIAAVTGRPVEQLTGPGTGLSEKGIQHKTEVIKTALKRRKPNPKNTFDILTKVGGFEIGAMAGAMLESARQEVPIIIDGLISAAAALIAKGLNDRVTDYMFLGHHSLEPGHQIAINLLNKEPLLNLNLHLGEGTGAALAYPLIRSASKMLSEMATFQSADVSEMT